MNSAGFIKIDTAKVSERTDAYVEVFMNRFKLIILEEAKILSEDFISLHEKFFMPRKLW